MSIMMYLKKLNARRLEKQRDFIFLLLKKIVKPHRAKNFDRGKIKSILIWNYEGIGDGIIISGFVKELQKKGICIYICSSEQNIRFCSDVLNIKRVYLVKDLLKQKVNVDLIFFIKSKTTTGEGIKLLRIYHKVCAKYIIGFDNPLGINDVIFDYEGNNHVTKRFEKVLDLLGIQNYDLSYKIDVNQNYEDKVLEYISQFKDKKLFV